MHINQTSLVIMLVMVQQMLSTQIGQAGFGATMEVLQIT
jgi:hypothetical protein